MLNRFFADDARRLRAMEWFFARVGYEMQHSLVFSRHDSESQFRLAEAMFEIWWKTLPPDHPCIVG